MSATSPPERWPSGDPDARNCARALPYGEVDPSPTKTCLMENAGQDSVREFFQLAFAKRPAEELYDLEVDPGQLENVAAQADYLEVTERLRQQLMQYLASTGDPRALGEARALGLLSLLRSHPNPGLEGRRTAGLGVKVPGFQGSKVPGFQGSRSRSTVIPWFPFIFPTEWSLHPYSCATPAARYECLWG